jgi:DNA-binding GntR family transcriptional regulator
MENAKWTTGDRVYEGLRASIMGLVRKPGEEIVINDISRELEVSRSPIRDALLKLEKEGLVDLVPQKGTFVSRIDLHRVHEERFLRESLEERILELFVAKRGEAELARLKAILTAQKCCLDSGDFAAFLGRDDEFHGSFFEATDMRRCWDIVQSMSGHYRRVRLLVLAKPGVAAGNYAQHREILDCLKSQDLRKLRSVIRNHLTKLDAEEGELLAEFPGYFAAQASKA